MERTPLGPEDNGPNDTPEKKKKRAKKSAPLRLPKIAEVGSEPKEHATKEPTALEKALADLAAQRRSEKESPQAADTPTQEESVNPGTDKSPSVTAQEGEKEKQEASGDDADTYEVLPVHELEPNELSGGEVIIRLHHDNGSTGERPAEHKGSVGPEDTSQPEAYTGSSTSDEKAVPVDPVAQSSPSFAAQPEQRPAQPTADIEQAPVYPTADSEPVPPTFSPEAPLLIRTPHAEVVAPAETALRPVSADAKPATQAELQSALHTAVQTGEHRGLATGILAGGVYEHFKHKRREKKKDKQLQRQYTQLEQIREDFNRGIQFQKASNAQAERELRPRLQEQARQNAENQARFTTLEKRFDTHPDSKKAAPKIAEQSDTEQLVIPDDHQLETSAWHAIEIDKKTGRPAEEQSFQYGQEYHRERAAETAAAALQADTAGGGGAVSAVSVAHAHPADDDGTGHTGVPPIPSATMQGPPTRSAQPKAPKRTDTTNTPLWPWVTALVIIVICLMIVLR